MSRKLTVAAATVAAGLAAPIAAAAQQPAELRAGQTITSALTAADPAMREAGRFKVYRVEVADGQRLVATLRSGAFDALLTLLRPVGGITEVIAGDDDGGGGSDARLRLPLLEAGSYLIVAQSFNADRMGAFTISLEEAAPPRAATPQPIRIGQPVQGRITAESPLVYDGDDDILYNLYTFDAKAGQELAILLTSDEFDAYLSFGRLTGSDIEITSRDDDGGGETNARIRVTIPEDGRYGFHARALNPDGTGRYTVEIREVAVEPPQPLAAGREITGTLGAGETDAENRFYQQWIYRGSAGERVSIRMRSDSFDTWLSLGRMIGGVFMEEAANDDAADDGSNSHIELVLPASGDYIIRATSYDGGVRGNYTLHLTSTR